MNKLIGYFECNSILIKLLILAMVLIVLIISMSSYIARSRNKKFINNINIGDFVKYRSELGWIKGKVIDIKDNKFKVNVRSICTDTTRWINKSNCKKPW